MSFREFTYPAVVGQLGLTVRADRLNADVAPAAVPADLEARIGRGSRLAQGLNTEKARSEFVIAPLLLDLQVLAPRPFGLFSGIELNVDPGRGLNGVCDFLLARDPLEYLLTAPAVAVVEAKNDNVWYGFGQCIATMVAVREFNRAAAEPPGPVHGVSTTGINWKFFRLDGGVLTIDRDEYHVRDLGTIMAILLRIVS